MDRPISQPPRGEEWTLSGRWVLPVDAPPLSHGVVSIRDERITYVGPSGSRRADLELGDVAVLPGLVNAHTHLDLSDAGGKCPPSPDFPGWLRMVGAHRRNQSDEQVAQAIRMGIDASLRYGITLLGDISVRGQSWNQVSQSPVHAVVFYEMIGLTEDRAAWGTGLTKAWLNDHPATHQCRPAFSLHAPYSVRKSVFEELGEGIVDGKEYPIAIHVAETEAELELLASRKGPFVSFLEDMGVWDPAGFVPDVAAVLARQTRRSLFIHGNYLSPGQWIQHGTLVWCPRTHAAFGHKPHPFREFLKQGTRVVLATDSMASNPDLDVLAEACFVHERYPDVPGDVLLKMITLDAAEALQWEHEAGSLTPGKLADITMIRLENDVGEPYECVLSNAGKQRKTLFRGRWR